jgi:hypothetical protein
MELSMRSLATACAAVAGLAFGATAMLSRVSDYEFPMELARNPSPYGPANRAVGADLKRCVFDWDSLQMQVTLHRKERQTSVDTWSVQDQELSTSFFITDVCARVNPQTDEVSAIFVAGVSEAGVAVLERWRFNYPAPGGSYVPLSQRSLPTVSRSVLFSGTSLGHIQSVAADPSGRFVLVLTWESHTIHQISTPIGAPPGAPQAVVLSSSVTQLTAMGTLYCRHHITLGRQYHVVRGMRWQAVSNAPGEVVGVVLPDANDDAVLETPFVVDTAAWELNGFNDADSWTSLWDL